MSKPAFFVTVAERDALELLEVWRAAWPSVDGRTWRSLAEKGLVAFGAAPGLTAAGRAWRALERAPRFATFSPKLGPKIASEHSKIASEAFSRPFVEICSVSRPSGRNDAPASPA